MFAVTSTCFGQPSNDKHVSYGVVKAPRPDSKRFAERPPFRDEKVVSSFVN